MSKIKKNKCQRCGKCCSFDFLNHVETIDIASWINEQRWDILSRINPEIHDFVEDEKIVKRIVWNVWINPKKIDNPLYSMINDIYHERCPFLSRKGKDGKYKCRIENTKPYTCKKYPQPGRKCIREEREKD